MSDMFHFSPFAHHYFLGYVSQVLPQFIKIHFPSSVLLSGFTHLGKDFNGGLVGNFVLIEGDGIGFLGRISELTLPESERLTLNEKAFQTSDFHPVGKAEILLTFDLYDPLRIKNGFNVYPSIGSKVFVCSSELVQHYMTAFGGVANRKVNAFKFGNLISSPETEVSVDIQALYSRHCAVVGTTGGGKSYTISTMVESLIKSKNKTILIDATGEYDGQYSNMITIDVGEGDNVFHFSQLTIDDLFFLLKPSPKVQLPRLMEAIRSLKIARIAGGGSLEHNGQVIPIVDGILKKANCQKRPYEVFYYKNISEIEDGMVTIDFNKLARQINEECVYDNGVSWGGPIPTDVSFCVSLMSRISNLMNTGEFNRIFGFQNEDKGENDITNVMVKFHEDPDKFLLRLNFKSVPFEFQVREILANAVARFLLQKARQKAFLNKPLVLFLDEAHQFMNKAIRDEYFETKALDAFELIAKECRKYGLFLCIATQMPRDIPHGTLSQMGTFIVHRLINYSDKEAIANACSSANKNSLDFLPILGEGEAVLSGVEFPMPILLKINAPVCKPNSGTPLLQAL